MNETLQKNLKRLDRDGNGKINIADAEALFQDELKKRGPKALVIGAFIGGLVAGFLAGRASK